MFTTLTLTGTEWAVKAIKNHMSKSLHDDYSVDMPFVRFFKQHKVSEAERKLTSTNIYPEIIFIAAVILSANTWHVGIATLLIWFVALFLILTLALTNARTRLLPNVQTRPLAGVTAVYAVVLS